MELSPLHQTPVPVLLVILGMAVHAYLLVHRHYLEIVSLVRPPAAVSFLQILVMLVIKLVKDRHLVQQPLLTNVHQVLF